MSNQRVLRGGWFYIPGYLRSAFRFSNPADFANYLVGFRLVQENSKDPNRVLRGGSWSDDKTYRDYWFPGYCDFDIGFRLIQEEK